MLDMPPMSKNWLKSSSVDGGRLWSGPFQLLGSIMTMCLRALGEMGGSGARWEDRCGAALRSYTAVAGKTDSTSRGWSLGDLLWLTVAWVVVVVE